MNMFNPHVLALLIGVPAVIVLFVFLAVSIIKRRRDANWARANELEQTSDAGSPATDALQQYDLPIEEVSDDEFFEQTVVEAALAKVHSTDVEALNEVRFRRVDFPTQAARERLVRLMKRFNPHVSGVTWLGMDTLKLMFSQVRQDFAAQSAALERLGLKEPKPARVPADPFDHECWEFPCDDKAAHDAMLKKDPDRILKEREDRINARQASLDQRLFSLEKEEEALEKREGRITDQKVRLMYEEMDDDKLAKAVKTLPGVFGQEHPHVKAARSVAEERIRRVRVILPEDWTSPGPPAATKSYDDLLKEVEKDVAEQREADLLDLDDAVDKVVEEYKLEPASPAEIRKSLADDYALLTDNDLRLHQRAIASVVRRKTTKRPTKKKAAKRRRR